MGCHADADLQGGERSEAGDSNTDSRARRGVGPSWFRHRPLLSLVSTCRPGPPLGRLSWPPKRSRFGPPRPPSRSSTPATPISNPMTSATPAVSTVAREGRRRGAGSDSTVGVSGGGGGPEVGAAGVDGADVGGAGGGVVATGSVGAASGAATASSGVGSGVGSDAETAVGSAVGPAVGSSVMAARSFRSASVVV